MVFNKIFSSPIEQYQYKQQNILIVEPDRERGKILAKLIKSERPRHRLLLIDNLEQIFSLIYGEVAIDLIFFDIEAEENTHNIALIKAIAPKITLIHWSHCQHPEIIELLYSLGINSFCIKGGDNRTIIEAMDLAGSYPQSLYLDKRLHNCLSLLGS
ncbi:MAG: hypothetical protein Tsb0014_03280 [Pleurocapsa sp.]